MGFKKGWYGDRAGARGAEDTGPSELSWGSNLFDRAPQWHQRSQLRPTGYMATETRSHHAANPVVVVRVAGSLSFRSGC